MGFFDFLRKKPVVVQNAQPSPEVAADALIQQQQKKDDKDFDNDPAQPVA
jgi:hypothetical protein